MRGFEVRKHINAFGAKLIDFFDYIMGVPPYMWPERTRRLYVMFYPIAAPLRMLIGLALLLVLTCIVLPIVWGWAFALYLKAMWRGEKFEW